jgi:hypothetical protein
MAGLMRCDFQFRRTLHRVLFDKRSNALANRLVVNVNGIPPYLSDSTCNFLCLGGYLRAA